ncbi:MAG: chromate efflux transporter [Bacillati bacterium ANGP1]|uniref:Chromate efflux transporter n=1 Tax=Candidatus Segetimicrobium genomatis TaxID=2569760 RepID=A0A537L6L7_9BACT|nr:MAG: chromate efflux transporter [Terrabacteria group bacterium ANGP1]
MTSALPTTRGRLSELAVVFLRLGILGFGGPAAHIAMMRDEVVRRRRWMTDQMFLDLVGATNLIPGPNSTEMAIHIGYARAGWRGLLVAGACFIIPAMVIVTAFAWAYTRYGTVPAAVWLLYGIKPVIIAVIAQALWSLGRTAVRGWLTAATGAVALGLFFAGVNELLLLAAGGLAVMLVANAGTLRGAAAGFVSAATWTPAAAILTPVPFAFSTLALVFLKIGSVLYGSGYVLLAFLRADFVLRLGWLTDRQLLDAVAVGQFTPGPVFTTATFIGYLLGGVPGAAVATAAIFLPAFVFVAASHPFIPRLRRSPWAGALLDGVNVTSLALMAGVTWQLGRVAVTDVTTAVLAVVSAGLLIKYRVNSAWLVLAGAAIGVARLWVR